MKKIVLIFLFIQSVWLAYAASGSITRPLSFGTVTYVASGGYTQLQLKTSNGTMNPTGNTGNMTNPTGSALRAILYITGLSGSGTIYVKAGLNGWTTLQGSCGTVSVRMIGKDNNPSTSSTYSSYTYKNSSSTLSIYLGGDVQLTQFNGTTCTISGTISDAVGWSTKKNSGYTNLSVDVSITIMGGNSLEHDTNASLDFGTFCASNSSQTLTVAPATGTNSTICPQTATSADSFTFTSSGVSSFNVSFPASVTLTGSNGGSATVTNLTSSCPSNVCSVSSGTTTFTVGGTISIPGGASSPPGDYAGNYIVNVTY